MSTCIQCEQRTADSLVWPGLCFPCAEEMDADMAKAEAEYSKPPCQRCGAMTREEAETKCRVSGGDDDHCHGSELWPD